jgi:hypothetical protein
MNQNIVTPNTTLPSWIQERVDLAAQHARQARLAALAGDHQAADQLRGTFDAIYDEPEANLSFFASVNSNSSSKSKVSEE